MGMGTLEIEEQTTSTMTDDRLTKKATISLPSEVTEEILSRLPVKSILRFRSLSKPWLSNISHPSFTKLHFTRATAAPRTALFISAYDDSTRKRHFLSAALDGGPVTHFMTLDTACSTGTTQAEHLNGLVFFTCMQWLSFYDHTHAAFVLNPSTHKIFKLPDPDTLIVVYFRYLFGFGESRNEHKILMFRKLFKPPTVEIMIFSMSNYSWRKIDAEPPVGFRLDDLFYTAETSVCVCSVVHLMAYNSRSFDILGFDLRTEKFLIIGTPQGVVPREMYIKKEGTFLKGNIPFIIKINGCVGIVCHDHVLESNEMHIWMLKDYENRVWVRETITFPESWIDLDHPFPSDSVSMDEIIFSQKEMFRNHVMSVPIYNKKSGCFKSLQFTLGRQFLCSKAVNVDKIRCYVESMVPL